MNRLIQLEAKQALLHREVNRLAHEHYLRKGYISLKLKRMLNATASLSTLEKYNPNWQNQPRVPSGDPDGGQWTSGGSTGSLNPSAIAPSSHCI